LTTESHSPDTSSFERTDLLHGVDNVINSELQFFSSSKKRIDTCMNYTRPSLAIVLEPIKKAFHHARSRGVRLRYITEITHDNISACKELVTMVDELRHLDGIKGNFMISESEYLAPLVLFEKGKIASQIIYSNVKEIVDQHQYVFDILWSKANSAQQRIKEIEEGTEHYQTKFLEKSEEVTKEIKNRMDAINSSDDWSICSTFDGLKMMYDNFYMQNGVLDNHTKVNRTKWIGNIDKNSIDLVKIFLHLGMQIKHIKNMPPMNFAVSSKEMYATIDEMKGGQLAKCLLTSNEPIYVKHFNFIFEELWKNGIEAKDRINTIEEGIDQSNIEIIQNPEESIKRSHEIIRSAKQEVLRIFSSVNAFRRQVRVGIMQQFKEMAEKHGIKVRILLPATDQQQITQIVNEETATSGLHLPYQIGIRSIDKSTQTSIGILVVDRSESLIIETKDDIKDNVYDAAGLAVYSDSKPIALSYASIFESLWKQSELYEQLKIHDKMQKEFINVAAHELRTPIQPILGLAEVLRSKKDEGRREEDDKQKNDEELLLLDTIIRNAKRLQRLTEDILDVTKIESQSLQLNKEQFNLREMMLNAIADSNNQLKKDSNIKLELVSKEDVFVKADKARLNQVIANLLSNAIKFTQEEGGIITIRTEIMNSRILVSIKDTGTGIDPEILPRLFTKFVTKPETGGTGLGLFISKSIIEAHGGRIWAENNANGEKGATFGFSLPISK
jgi:two-component system sensor histidine kinase VicK